MRKIVNTAICLLLVLAMTVPAFADTSQGTATTLKLEKTEGKVNITKSAGKSVTVKDGIRLYDGYTVKTEKNSKAYVSLDQSKAIMLDASTTCSVRKSGKKLEIMLQSGTVLVNVEDKLAGDEELNIRTTNSVTGIRGTIAQFTFNSTTQNTEVYLFEGRTTGTYLAPDGSWYTQELVSGSWLASGRGMLSDHPEYNGWTKQEDGTWLYTNNNINSPANASYFWGKGTGWFMMDSQTGEISTKTAWPFTFPMLEPAVQKEIINDESMLKRGQEHLDLYPELAEDKLPETKAAAEEALAQQQEETEKKSESIIAAYDEGNGGNSVDNLFAEQPRRPSTPSYVTVSFNDNTGGAGVASLTVDGTPVTANADGSYTIPYGKDYTFDLGAAVSYKVTKPNGDYIARDNNLYTYTDNATSSMILTIDNMPTAGIHDVKVSFHDNLGEAWIASYSSNVLSVSTYTDPAVENGYILTLEDGQTLSFTVGETDSYGVRGFETGGTDTLTQISHYDYSVAPEETLVQLYVASLNKVYSSSATLTLDPGSDAPVKTFADGRFYFESGKRVKMDISGYSTGDTAKLFAFMAGGNSPIVSNISDGITNFIAGSDGTVNDTTGQYEYEIIYSPTGFHKVSLIGTTPGDITMISTADMLFHYTENGDEVYLVTAGTEFVFASATATGITEGEADTPLAIGGDGYYHVTINGDTQLNVSYI